MRTKRFAMGTLLLVATGAGCFSEPASSGATSGTSSGSSGGGATEGPVETTEVGSTEVGSTGVDTVGTFSTGRTSSSSTGLGTSGSSSGSSSTSEGPSETSTTSDVNMELCPEFIDPFDGNVVDPVWESEHGSNIEQLGGATVITLSTAANDVYPRRMIPWSALGVVGQQVVSFSVQPVAAPTIGGTQFNLVFEGAAPGNDVTLSLNNPPSGLEYRITSNIQGTVEVLLQQPTTFPPGGSLQGVVDGAEITFAVFDADGVLVEELVTTGIPFDVETSRMGFAANNYLELVDPAELAAESFAIVCE